MLFKRRNTLGIWEKFRLGLWPRTSWRRSVLYYGKRVLRLSATPHAIAAGFAVGAGVSMTPFIGLHFLITFSVAWLLRGNLIAAAIGTVVGNPVSFPFILAGTHRLGSLILYGKQEPPPAGLTATMEEFSVVRFWSLIEPTIALMKPMIVGGIPVGLVVGTVLYMIVYKGVAAYQRARRERFASRRAVERATGLAGGQDERVGVAD